MLLSLRKTGVPPIGLVLARQAGRLSSIASRRQTELCGVIHRPTPPHLLNPQFNATLRAMSTLAEIETAADSLPSEQKEELLRFLAMRLRKERTLPKPRIYFDEELASMLNEDQQANGAASDWLRTAKGSVRAAVGESADDVRMTYYTAKYGVTQ